MLTRVSDLRVGAAFRAVRLRRNWRQLDVAVRAGVSDSLISEIERGHLTRTTIESIRRIGDVLEIRVDVSTRWRGGDLDRVMNIRHQELGDAVTAMLRSIGWQVAVEVSFSIAGERGLIDLLAWHPVTRALLVIELKTEIVDAQELLGVLDRKTRLAARIARERGWVAATVSSWLVVAEGSTNRHRANRLSSLFRSALPADGRTMDRWLRSPSGHIGALSFFSDSTGTGRKQSFAGRKRSARRIDRPLSVGDRAIQTATLVRAGGSCRSMLSQESGKESARRSV
jgi:transcriptional regulator with XRE-family HTH domain